MALNGIIQKPLNGLKFKKAANQGNSTAQFNLGIMYEKARGVEQNDFQAFKWIEKAANQDLAIAQFGLGLYYNRDQGVRQNYEQAVNWYLKAADQRHAGAFYMLETMVKAGILEKRGI